MRRAFNREDPFVIWGSADQVRDFIHVDDIVGAVMAFVEAGEQGPINIGTSAPTSMRELALTATMQLDYVPKFVPLADKPAGVMYRVASTAKMLGLYKPKISIEEGVARALAKLATEA
jgi:nucleoside-diphosphate-sugar epimerase